MISKGALAVACGTLATLALADTSPAPTPPVVKPAKVFIGGTLDAAGSDMTESTAGDLVADAVRETGHADIGLVPSDEIVSDTKIELGSHDPADLLSLLHYTDDTDTVVVLNLTGKQVLAALERSVSRMPDAFDGFLQVSGLQFRFDRKRSIGRRVMEADIPDTPISETKHYTVATTRALANGSFGYFLVWDKSAIAKDTGVTIGNCLTDYAASHNTLNPMIEGRIVGL